MFESFCSHPLVRYSLKKMEGKQGEWGKVFIEPLSGVAIFLRSVETHWDVLGL
jgi:hypothetical protein